MQSTSTVLAIPCLSGAPWELKQLTPLTDLDLRTLALPDEPSSIDAYADVVRASIEDLDDVVLVGDSFGAVVALAVAVRRPSNLRGLVVSGGFAADPITDPLTRAKVAAARFLPGPLYRQLVLRLHAAALASPHDAAGQQPWSRADSRQLFVDHTPHRTYVRRSRAAFDTDLRDQLQRIEVPTLILTPTHDRLIGPDAARALREGIPNATEVVLPDTGHMFRFSHPVTYAAAIRGFLDQHELATAAFTGAQR